MKKFTVLAACLVLAACSKTEESKDTKNETPTGTENAESMAMSVANITLDRDP